MDDSVLKFHEFVERLVRITHEEGGYDRQAYLKLLYEMCEYYDLAKATAEFYPNVSFEARGQGEIFCDFDTGHADILAARIRIVSKTQAVVIGSVHVSKERGELSPEDKDRIDVLLRLTLSFLSRNRLQRIVEKLGFNDEKDYPNFRAFVRYLETLNVSGGLAGKSAFHCDIHNFGLVNQDIGVSNGDVVMKRYYNYLSDIIGSDGIICRLGGDKFIGVFTGAVRDKVLEAFSGVNVIYDEKSDNKLRISCAAGVFDIPDDFKMNSVSDVMDKITMPSAIAKRQEDGAIIFYNEEMKKMRDHMKHVSQSFYNALHNEEFHVYYQPKVDVFSKEIVGAEALCRWIRDGKIIPPMEFIPILEQNTDICALDFYMLDHTCKDIRRWLDEGKNVVKVSVNLSRKHLVDVNLLEHIMSIIDKNNVPHEYIEIELTETTTDVKFLDLKRVVGGLRERGISTAVDDFGMGYSSLNLIRDIPWDVLKIDKSFLPTDDESDRSVTSVMFRHVISMAQDMGLKCVVEGVETEEQVELLRVNFCSIAQGFFFDKPLPVNEFEERLSVMRYS